MKKTSLCTIIVFILSLAVVNMYFSNQINAQTSPSPSPPSSSNGAKVVSSPPSSSNGAKVASSPSSTSTSSSNKPVSLGQLKSSIFADLAKCITTQVCRPLMGSEGDDRITGGNGSNVIIGLGGNDIIHGGTGDNIIIGGQGDNALYGGGGNNIIVASGTGLDQIYGGNKSNILIAGGGSTLLVAGKGNDKLYGGGGNNVFIGGPGADYFSCGIAGTGSAGSKSVVLNFNAAKGDDTDGNCGTVLGQ
jgi:hypothetical protein